MLERSVKKDEGASKAKGKTGETESVLKGDISQAQFKKGITGTGLNNVCQITEKHSYANGASKDPCNGKGNGKDQRFKIETQWKDTGKSGKHVDVYLPPRREHICTSNLEYLLKGNSDQIMKVGNNKINHSFLGEVLLAAKYEADYIKTNYKRLNGQNNNEDKCRAMKYSFADIGDIIRGKDLWEHNDFKKLEEHLVQIFNKIKDQITDIKDNYTDNAPYTKLREDWWEANRDQVWKAMQCQTTPHHNINCGDTPPLVDYIPQRLRWMMEWAEWYCKYQSKAYEDLRKKCGDCKEMGGQCMHGKNGCENCMKACGEYWKKIKPWKKQWETISAKYEKLYKEAEHSVNGTVSSGGTTEEKDKDVVEFLKKLCKQNKDYNKIYSTAEGYVHQELPDMGCKEQTLFCKNSNGKDKEKYAFRTEPYDHDDLCDCGSKTPKGTVLREPCTIVDGILNKEYGEMIIGCCEPKTEEPYAQWKCNQESGLVTEDGICMPPRRQELCVHYLKKLNVETETKEQDLREAFIQCAAAETYLLWQKYKDDKNKKKNDNVEGLLSAQNEAQNELNSGIIPPEFLRTMFYTFGDYRDICLGTDISKKNGEESDIKNKIYSIIPSTEEDKSPPELTRKGWWNEYAPAIWEGMLCALQKAGGNYTIKYTYNYNKIKNHVVNFVERPTFLRWFTEWGDQFCREREKQLATLLKECPEKTCAKEGDKQKCTEACTTYEEFIEKWKGYYDKQSKKYFYDISTGMYKDNSSAKDDVTVSSYAYEYLNKALPKLCPEGSCNCMEQRSQQHKDATDSSPVHLVNMPASLDETPSDYKDRCKCKEEAALPH
ncbi:hypothetical protein PFTANZ_04202, partial [Plasmodium falciparum Tanzania (2000708)]